MSGRNTSKAMPSDFLGIDEDDKTPWSWLFDLNQRQLVNACTKNACTRKWMLAYEEVRIPLFASPDKTPIGTAATKSKIAGHQLSEDGEVILTSGVGLMPYRHALLTTWASNEDITLAKKRLRIIKRQHAPVTEETKSLKSSAKSPTTGVAVVGGEIKPGTKYAEQIREFECQLQALEQELSTREEKRELQEKRAARSGKTVKTSAKSSPSSKLYRQGLDDLIDIIRESDRAKLRASQMKRPRYDDDDK